MHLIFWIGWLVVLEFNSTLTAKVISYAVGDAYVFPGFLTPVLTLLFFQSHRLLFSHASAEVRSENTPERKVASTWDRTHNHQVMSPTRSPLSHPGGFDILEALQSIRRCCRLWFYSIAHTFFYPANHM